ncbi:metallophosphoesterase family protein [Bradyrhizobium sp. 76]|uniref:metallophosphoesterase family protein n=1 Tax=Bradyrhizobium sp. 76 TaxID=2782680 RepID=UPI001FFBD42D|nr:metallophosphoesterase family protein [Bradyrhizobium sp. 76]MCK1404952.1 serine/threonine protein phosphatase [Bradyrhizobium sp. 76]
MVLEAGMQSRPKPRLPDGIRIYAIGDVHGRADLLRAVFAAIDLHLSRSGPARALHVFLGDYIDRGPETAATIDLLIDRSQRHETVFLKGNHEAFFLEVVQDPPKLDAWREFGGFQTLMSYGLRPSIKPDRDEQDYLVKGLLDIMPRRHQHFLSNLRPCFACGDFFFAHAGVKPGVPLRQQREEDLLWIRDEFLQSEQNFGKYVVHGHTPVAKPDIRPNRINIDTGAYASGILTLLTIQDERMFAI